MEMILAQPAVLQQLAHPHLAAQIASAHHLTHFQCHHNTSPALPLTGTRPGSALADAIFNISFHLPLRLITGKLKRANLYYSPTPLLRF